MGPKRFGGPPLPKNPAEITAYEGIRISIGLPESSAFRTARNWVIVASRSNNSGYAQADGLVYGYAFLLIRFDQMNIQYEYNSNQWT